MAGLSVNNLGANLTNPALPFLFDLRIPQLPGGGDTETVMLRCQSTEIPGKKFTTIEVPYKQGPKIQFPGKLEFDHDFTCSFVESEDGAMFATFYNWTQAIIDDVNNQGGNVQDYKKPIYLHLVTRGDNTPYRTFRLDGAYVSNIGKESISYNDDSKMIMVTVTFRFDSWVLEV